MIKASILACALVLLCASVAVFAQTPSHAPVPRAVLAAILGQPVAAGSCEVPASRVLFASQPPPVNPLALCSATAHCASGTVSCQGNNSVTSCTGVDRDCSNFEP